MPPRLVSDNGFAAINLRRTELGLIHKGANNLALTDDSYRGFLRNLTGKESSGEMTSAERRKVIDRLRQLGALRDRAAYRASFGGGQAGMARGLWIELHRLGAVDDASDQALDLFVRRQTGGAVAAARFLISPQMARPVIEALKASLVRARATKRTSP